MSKGSMNLSLLRRIWSSEAVGSVRSKAARKCAVPRTAIEALEVRTLFSTIVVNSTGDQVDALGSGIISLRDAVTSANASGTNTITFDKTIFSTHQTIALGGTQLELGGTLTIQGPAAGVTISGNNTSRVFLVPEFSLVTISNVEITGGRAASGDNGGGGGGIFNQGSLTLKNSTVTGNTSAFVGGGIESINAIDPELTLINDTISGNTTGGNSEGGGVSFSGTATVEDSTISGNTSSNGGGGIAINTEVTDPLDGRVYRGTLNISNTVVAGNAGGTTSPDVKGNVSSLGYNFIGIADVNNGWLQTDVLGTATTPIDPALGTLKYNGGPTRTLLPLANSPLIDAGSNALVPAGITTDQRGFARIYVTVVDIGSVEVQPITVTVTASTLQQAIVGIAQSFSLGSFTEMNATAPYTIDVNWGDSTGDTIFTATGAGRITPQSHTYAAVGTYTVNVTVTDSPALATGSAKFDVIVVPGTLSVTAPANQSAFVGQSTPFTLGTIVQINGVAPYSVDVDWGDGSADTVISDPMDGDIPLTSHTYNAEGADTVKVTATDATGTLTGVGTFGVVVITGTTISSTSLAVSTTTISFGQSITMTANVLPTIATGVVTFLEDSIVVGSAPVTTGGISTFTTTALPSGTDSITATYDGSATYAVSTSSPISVFVVPPTTTTLQSSTASTSTAQYISLEATVAPSSFAGFVASGTVTFMQGTTVLGTAVLMTNGTATFNTTASLPVGLDPLTAIYNGDTHFSGSTSAALNVNVIATSTITVVSSSAPSKTAAQIVTLAATVERSAGVVTNMLVGVAPTGTVTFLDGATVIGTVALDSDGVASMATSADLSTGLNIITASYSGSTDGFFTTSGSNSQNVFVTPHALVPVVGKVSVPTTAIGGATVHASVTAALTNQLANLESGTESGPFTTAIYASTSTTLDPDTDVMVASTTKKAALHHGQKTSVTVRIKQFPASLAAGTYHLLLQTTDSAGNTESIDTGSTVTIVAPVISLSAAFAAIPASVLKKGAAVSLTNSGNIDDLSKFTAIIGITTDSAGQDIVASGIGIVKPVKTAVRAGKSTNLHVTGWQSVFGSLSAGSYYLTITLTDAAGNTAFAVSSLQTLT